MHCEVRNSDLQFRLLREIIFLYLCTSYVYLLVTTANKTLYSLANVSLGTSLLICVEGELSAPRILDTVAPLFLREFQLRSLLPTLPSLSENVTRIEEHSDRNCSTNCGTFTFQLPG